LAIANPCLDALSVSAMMKSRFRILDKAYPNHKNMFVREIVNLNHAVGDRAFPFRVKSSFDPGLQESG